MNTTNHIEIEAALQRIRDWPATQRTFPLTAADGNRLREATERAAGQLLVETENVLTIALAGCSGAGKSTLINALAGSSIARVAEERPCTSQIQVYHHAEVGRGGLPKTLTSQPGFVAHDRPALRSKVIVDTPDLDTFAAQHRLAAKALLKSAGLVIYVFSPEKYWEERAWSVIREEQRFSAAIAVLNKADTVAPAIAEKIVEEIRHRFAEIGSPDIQVLHVCATRHTPDHRGEYHTLSDGILDEFTTLRASIEQELQAGDIVRMRQAQRIRVIDYLEGIIDQIALADLSARFDTLQEKAEERAKIAGEAFTQALAPRLEAAEEELAPLAALRRQQLFWGPLRLWLALINFLGYGLPQLVRRFRFLHWGKEKQTDLQRLIVTGMSDKATIQLRAESAALQNHCFATGLPVGHWQQTTAGSDGNFLLHRISSTIHDHFIATTAILAGPRRLAWVLSLLGMLTPGVLLIFALVQIVRSLATLEVMVGYQLVGLAFIGVVLCQLLLTGIASFLIPVRRSITGQRGLAGQCVRSVMREMILNWVSLYRSDLETDLTKLRQPLVVLRGALDKREQVEVQTTPLHSTGRNNLHHGGDPEKQSERLIFAVAPATIPTLEPELTQSMQPVGTSTQTVDEINNPTMIGVQREANPFLQGFRAAYSTETIDVT